MENIEKGEFCDVSTDRQLTFDSHMKRPVENGRKNNKLV